MMSINSIFASIEQAYRKTEAAFRSLSESTVDAESVISECMDQFDGLFLDRGSETSLSAYFRYLLSNEESLRDTPFNFMLVEDRYADEICMAFYQALRIITGREQEVLSVDERMLLRAPEEELSKLGKCSVYVIRNCSEKPMSPKEAAAWQQTAELFERTPCIVKILRASKDVIETRFREFDHIYYRVFRNKLSCRDASTEEIEQSLHRALMSKNFSWAPAFETGLHEYLAVVYPKADLKDAAFVKDMVERITSRYYERKRDGLVLDADCVPFYIRPVIDGLGQDGPETADGIPAPEEAHAVEETRSDEDAPAQEGSAVREAGSFPQVENKVSEQGTVDEYAAKGRPNIKNILIVSLSTFPNSRDGAPSRLGSCTYSYRDEEQGTYCFQQEPFPMHLKEKLKGAGEILMLTTRETRIPVQIEAGGEKQDVSPQEYFMSAVREIPELEGVVFKSIAVDQEAPAGAVSEVVEHLREVKKRNERSLPPKIYLGTNGGLRGIQLILEAILSLLMSDGISVNSDDVWSLRQETGNRYAIYNSAAEFRIFDLVSGINEFQNYGRIHSLERFIKSTGDATALELLKYLTDISEGIQFCSIRSFTSGLKELSAFYENDPASDDPYIQMFLNNIKKSFGSLLKQNHEVISEIEWCVEKGFFQQAFTLIENSMPEVYCQKEIMVISEEALNAAETYKRYTNDTASEFLFNSVVNNRFIDYIKDHETEWNDPRHYAMRRDMDTPYVRVAFNTSSKEARTISKSFKRVLLAHWKVKSSRNDLMHGNEPDGVTIEGYRKELTDYLTKTKRLFAAWDNWKKEQPALPLLSLQLSRPAAGGSEPSPAKPEEPSRPATDMEIKALQQKVNGTVR